MPALAPGRLAMIFADLPYGIMNARWDTPINLKDFWEMARHVCQADAKFVFTATQPFTTTLINSNGKSFKYDIVWQKTIPTGMFHAKNMPMRAHESVLIFADKKGTYNPQMTPCGDNNAYRPKTIYKADNIAKGYGGKVPQIHRQDPGVRYPISVQRIGSLARRNQIHFAEKPVGLLEWLIKTYTNSGDTVLDPTFGSCPTGVACARLGRSFIGIEKDPEYFRIGRERVDAERAKLGLQPCSTQT